MRNACNYSVKVIAPCMLQAELLGTAPEFMKESMQSTQMLALSDTFQKPRQTMIFTKARNIPKPNRSGQDYPHSTIVVGKLKAHDLHLVGEGEVSRPFCFPLQLCVLPQVCISYFG
jgi:hypothetical protein